MSSPSPHEDLGHKCGIVAVAGHADAAELAYYALYSLQHRGQESAGIAVWHGGQLKPYLGMGLIGEIFKDDYFKNFTGATQAIGHTRYSTTGSSRLRNAQPITVDTARGQLSIAHNGNLTNAFELRRELEEAGSIFQTTSDSEIILHLLARQNGSGDAWVNALRRLEGAFCYVGLEGDTVVAARDRHGYRPLAIGRKDSAFVFASETCAFDMIGAEYIDEVKPGEVVRVRNGKLEREIFRKPDAKLAHCIFEHVYFARPDSRVFADNVHSARVAMGRQLAREHPANADIVIPVPDSGNAAAAGFAAEARLPLAMGFVRNHYIGRSFIQPSQRQRDIAVKIKLNANRSVVEGMRVAVIDDSIIRGTTSRSRMARLREAGAKEVHLRISCPPTKHPCFFGIDFPDPKELVANQKTLQQIVEYLEVDSLGYLSEDGMLSAVTNGRDFCTACFSGNYRSLKPGGFDKLALDKDEVSTPAKPASPGKKVRA